MLKSDKLKKMEKQGLTRKVSEHVDCRSSLAYPAKEGGSLGICIHPQKLDQALKRCPYNVSTLGELNARFAGSTVFSKLSTKAGYWSIHLDPDSQLIITFRTLFGRYCWIRLPFGLRCHKTSSKPEWKKSWRIFPGWSGSRMTSVSMTKMLSLIHI